MTHSHIHDSPKCIHSEMRHTGSANNLFRN